MEAKDVLSFLFQRADAMQTFWNIFLTVVTAILGLAAAAKKEWLNKLSCAVITIGFAIFAYSNFDALNSVREQQIGLLNMLPSANGYSSVMQSVADAARPAEYYQLVMFHLILDAAVILLIWLILFIRTRKKADNK